MILSYSEVLVNAGYQLPLLTNAVSSLIVCAVYSETIDYNSRSCLGHQLGKGSKTVVMNC